MSLFLVQKPQVLTPCRNQIVWVFNSNNSNQNGFRYIFTIYDKNNNFIAKLTVAKEPKFGYGYADISSIISDNINYDINTTGLTSSLNNSIFEYKLNISETYLYYWDFIDNVFNNGNVGFISTSQPQFIVGDIIEVSQQYPYTNTSYEGQTQVISVTFSSPYWYVITNKPFGVSTPPEPGKIYYSNRKKTINIGPTYSGFYSFNGRKSHKDFINWNCNEYIINSNATSSTNKFLTDLPNEFHMTPEQDMWLNMFRGTESNNSISVRYVNSNGDILQYNNIWSQSYNSRGGQLAVGPGNATYSTIINGSGPIVKDTTEWYDIYMVNQSNGIQVSEKKRIIIDRRCKIENYEILFMDKMGSFLSYAFQLRSKETFTVDRKEYNKFLGVLSSDGWSYNTQDAGYNIYSINSKTELELNTNWMNDASSFYFRQLIESPVTFLKDVDGLYYPVIVIDNGGEVKKQKNGVLIRKSIKVRYANNEISNI